MEKLIKFCKEPPGGLHPVQVAAVAHYNFVRIHPFRDGNSRGSRILNNLLIKSDLPPAIVAVEDRDHYLQALREADRGNIHPFVMFIASERLMT